MRAAILLASMVVPSAVFAEPLPGVVWHNRVIAAPPTTAATFTSVSHILYLNDCKNSHCRVSPGNEDSLTNHSSIPASTVTLPAYPWGTTHWNQLIECVRDTFKPFDIYVVTEDPGMTSHFEVMVGGRSTQLNPQLQAGGVAPYIGCGATENNVISFAFAQTSSDLEYLCAVVAQEASHVWGLDHELNAKDPMTYLDLLASKRFQDDDARCGENLNAPRDCECGTTRQNTVRYFLDTFGPADPTQPAVTITTPLAGAWVEPGFVVQAMLVSQVAGRVGHFAIDGAELATTPGAPYELTTPADLAGGPHSITVTVTDLAERTATATVDVNVLARCGVDGSCATGACIGGYCQPDATTPGGLGTACTNNDECISGLCAGSAGDSVCSGMCDAGDTCPQGYECVTKDGAQVCWPEESGGGSGGCSSSAGGSHALFGFGLAMLALRRRRR